MTIAQVANKTPAMEKSSEDKRPVNNKETTHLRIPKINAIIGSDKYTTARSEIFDKPNLIPGKETELKNNDSTYDKINETGQNDSSMF